MKKYVACLLALMLLLNIGGLAVLATGENGELVPDTDILPDGGESTTTTVEDDSEETTTTVGEDTSSTSSTESTTSTESSASSTESTSSTGSTAGSTTSSSSSYVTFPTRDEEEGTTHQTVYNTLTTTAVDNGVVTNVITDVNILQLLGVQDILSFESKVRVTIDSAQYNALVDGYGAPIYGEILTSPIQVTENMILRSVADNKNFEKISLKDPRSFTFSFALRALDETTDEEVYFPSGTFDTVYTVTLPVPASMAGYTTFGLAEAGETRLSNVRPLTVENGMLTFTVDSLDDDYAIIAFKAGTQKMTQTNPGNLPTGQLRIILIVLYVVGGLLIAGALVVFFWPKLKPLLTKKP